MKRREGLGGGGLGGEKGLRGGRAGRGRNGMFEQSYPSNYIFTVFGKFSLKCRTEVAKSRQNLSHPEDALKTAGGIVM